MHSHDLVELEKLCKMSPVRISMGESLRNSCFFKAYADAGVGVLQANPPLWGYFDWIKVYDMCKAYGIEFSGNTGGTDWFSSLDDENIYMEYLRPNGKPFSSFFRIPSRRIHRQNPRRPLCSADRPSNRPP